MVGKFEGSRSNGKAGIVSERLGEDTELPAPRVEKTGLGCLPT
jgi:hypothetical protein